jgi:hypothetical protein
MVWKTTKSFEYYSGHTLDLAKYGYLKGSLKYLQIKKESTTTALNTMLASVHTHMT